MPLRRLLAVAGTVPPTRPLESAPTAPPLWRLVRLVEIAGRYATPNPTCLKQALVLAWLLRRRGVPTSLHIGVRRRDGRLAAHAWLERDGDVIFGGLERTEYERLLVSDAAGVR